LTKSSTLTYLDHAATAPLRPEVAAAMAEVHDAGAGALGNPTGSHPAAQRARRLLEEARDEVAAFLGRDPGDVVFTSGGTESANLAFLGPAEAARQDRGEAVLLYSAVEHPAVREAARAAAKAGLDTRELPVDQYGIIDTDALARTLSSRVTSVAVMTANNETGVLQPLPELIETVRRRAPNAYVFTDAVQAAPFVDLAEATAGADLVSLSAHKVGGPVGVGALAVAGRVALEPRQYGGGQERERRSGTQDVAGAVGLATALRLVAAERATVGPRVAAQRDRLRDGLLHAVPGAYRTVPEAVAVATVAAAGVGVLPGHLHLCVPGLEREELLVALGEEGLCVSGGSSCASGALQPSHVLAAMGVAPELAAGAVRFSLGYGTTDDDIDRALAVVPAVVAALRQGG
jgi:cysteine desulfurase